MHAIPAGWDQEAHTLWVRGAQEPAIMHVVERLNESEAKPRSLFAQIGYYTYLIGNYVECARFLSLSIEINGPDAEIQKNMANALHKLKRYDEALEALYASSKSPEDDPNICDLICAIYAAKGDHENARKFGELSLVGKDKLACTPKGLSLKPVSQRAASHSQGRNIVSFSLWGKNPRYLRGALRNALLMGDIYPGWSMRIYAGSDVPSDLLQELASLEVEIIARDANMPILQRLGWRFEVANDPGVNRFLVRDIDSAVNIRESHAVQDWIASGKPFHVMRDWWSHTDTMLAGMWGGLAGILPSLSAAMQNYKSNLVETPNVDQWFLKDQIWPLIRSETLLHDRFFRALGAAPFPGPELPYRGGHVGQDEIAVRAAYQDRVLAPWIEKLSCLRLSLRS